MATRGLAKPAHYWKSLLGIVVVLGLFFYGVLSATSLLGMLYDRISPWPVWDTPLWLSLKVPLIILAVFGSLTAIIALIHRQDRKALRLVREHALSMGWSFSKGTIPEVENNAAQILADLKIELQRVRTVEDGARSIHLFDCAYVSREAVRRQYSHGVACMIRSVRFPTDAAQVDIYLRDWTELLSGDKVDLGETPFAQRFTVICKDPESARIQVTPALQAILLEHAEKPLDNPVSVMLGPGGAVVLAGQTFEAERLEALVDLARRIEAALPS